MTLSRRFFIKAGALSSVLLVAKAGQASTTTDQCLMKIDQITAEATGFSRYEHHHQLSIPLSVLISPPHEGFKIRTSSLDQGSLDEKAFQDFIKETGLNGPSLLQHSHEVKFTQEELEKIAQGEKDVKISVLSPKGNPAHDFYFTAPRSALIKIKKARERKA